MTPAALISDLATRGIDLRADGDNLRIGPKDRLTSADVDLLRQHKLVILRLLRSEGRETSAYPIVPGREHFSFWLSEADRDAGKWGQEFVPGFHYDIRQPSRLRPPCSPRFQDRGQP